MKKIILLAAIAASALVVVILSRRSPDGARDGSASQARGAATSAPQRKIDLDLVRMSKTMRDAWVVKIVERPDEVAGKTVRISGDFYTYDDSTGNPQRYVCALKDPAGCCVIGEVEFFLRGKHEWPKDFPEEFSSITLTGRLEIARNGDGTARPRLVEADMSWASR